MDSLSPIRAQERYTTTFDMTPPNTLNMTYHRFGDGEKRAGMLAYLQEIYCRSGYAPNTGDLPDYLPLMLEFLSQCPDAPGGEAIWDCLEPLGKLIHRLREVAPPYAQLLVPLEDIRKRMTDASGRPENGNRGQ